MSPSNNSFTKDTPQVSANTFSQDGPTVSTNSFATQTISKGSNAWEGDNLTSGALPGDLMSGNVPGLNELGGIGHIKRTVAISH